MKKRYLSTALALGIIAPIVLPSHLGEQTVHAVEFSDGRTAFLRPPQFLDAFTTNDTVIRRNATYFFSLDLPADADEPLQSVVIAPQNLVRFLQPYQLDKTTAFEGTPRNEQAELGIGNVSVDDDTKAVTVDFDPPVPPGRVVTIALRPRRTPRRDGIYVFRVTAIPQGEQPQAHIAGHGRLFFIDRDRGFDRF